MLTSITLTIPEELSQAEKSALRYLFADALSGFQRQRSDSEYYVAMVYGHLFDEKGREEKIAQVRMRVALAEKVRTAALTNMVVNTTEPVEGSEAT